MFDEPAVACVADPSLSSSIVREKKLSPSAQRIIPIYRDLSDKSWPYIATMSRAPPKADRICFRSFCITCTSMCFCVNDAEFLIWLGIYSKSVSRHRLLSSVKSFHTPGIRKFRKSHTSARARAPFRQNAGENIFGDLLSSSYATQQHRIIFNFSDPFSVAGL